MHVRVFLVFVGLGLWSRPAQAQAALAPVDATRDSDARLGALEARLRLLESERSSEKSRVALSASPGKGITVATADGRFSSSLRFRLQLRETVVFDSTDTTSDFALKTIRLRNEGHALVPELRYSIQLALGAGDFEKDNSSPLFDAYVEYTKLDALNVRVGQFFVPFGRARSVRECALSLVDRPQSVREFSLDRDVGLRIGSSDTFFGRGVLGYSAFVGSGDGKNRVSSGAPGVLLVGRLMFRPFGAFDDDVEGDLERERRPRLALGLSAAYNHATNRQQSTFGNTLSLGTLDYTHGAVDVAFKYGGLAVLAEAAFRKASTEHLDAIVDGAPRREWARSGVGYFVQVGTMVHSRVELVARWDHLQSIGATDPKLVRQDREEGHQAGFGASLYLNGHFLKLQADYFHVRGATAADIRNQARLQLDASF